MPDNLLSALGYVLLRDTYRYVCADGRTLLRDALQYPCGASGLIFVFDAGDPRQVDVGGDAVTSAGLVGLLRYLAGRGFGTLIYSAVNSGALLNLCYGNPNDLEALDPSHLVRSEPSSGLLRVPVRGTAPVRDAYAAPAVGPGAMQPGEYLAMPYCNESMFAAALRRMDAFFRVHLAGIPVGQDPLGGAGLAAMVVPPGGVGDFNGTTTAVNANGHVVRFVSTNWQDEVQLSPDVPVFAVKVRLEWRMLCFYYSVTSRAGAAPDLDAMYDRPNAATHLGGRLLHSQDLSAGYLVPQYDPAHVAMVFANLYVGTLAAVANLPTPVYYTDADHAARARKAFRMEHSLFVYSMADRGVKPEDLEAGSLYAAGMYAAKNASSLRAMVLPPRAPDGWGGRAQFESYELGNYGPYTLTSPYRGMSGEVVWTYTADHGEASFTDSADGRRAQDALLRNLYSRGGTVELSRAAAKQHRIFRYCAAAAAGAAGPRYAIYTGGSVFSHYRRGTTKYRAAFSGRDAAGIGDDMLRRQRLDRDTSIRLWCG